MRASAISRRGGSVRRVAIHLASVAMLLIAASLSFPSGAQSNDDLDTIREERRQAQEQAAAQAGLVDAANVEVGELTAALEALQTNVVAKEVDLANAQRQLVEANRTLAESEAAVLAKEGEIEEIRDRLASRAITSFVNQGDVGSVFVQSGDPTQAARMQALVEEVTQTDVDIGEELRAAEEDLEVERAIAQAASTEAERLEEETSQQLLDLETARDAQAELTIEAEARLEHLLVELAAIEELDKDLARRESAALDSLMRELARKRSTSGTSSGTAAIPIPPNSEIVKASGFWVHISIADSVTAMISAANADGINLGGGGWRDSANQVALRKAHCGTSDYAIWEMPSSQCRPPTARPGASMHERGLALDFTYNGKLIGTRNNEGYRWLAANAGKYGFINLPSEPWHWSTNGN